MKPAALTFTLGLAAAVGGGLGVATFRTHPCPGFGRVFLITSLPARLFNCDWLALGPQYGRPLFTPEGEPAWAALQDLAHQALADEPYPPGDMTAVVLADTAIDHARREFNRELAA